MNVTVSEAGTIHWKMSEGASLAPGSLMAELELDDPQCVTKATVSREGGSEGREGGREGRREGK